MESDWKNMYLGDVAELIRGVAYKPESLLEGPNLGAVPLIRATNIGTREIDLGEVLHVPSHLVKKSQLLQKFDVVIAMSSGSRAAVGRLAQLRKQWHGTFGAFCGAIRPVQEQVDPEYLGYVLCDPAFRVRIDACASGTAIMNLSKDHLLGHEIQLPNRVYQRTVAKTLGSLDDRIDHNRDLAKNIEAIARRLFKSWFVDFDPVRAKAAGEKPVGLADDIAALFPDRFVDSELGEVPEGWECHRVSELCEAIFSGGTPHTQTPEYWGGELPWLSSGETRSQFIVDTEKTITQIGIDNSSTRLARAGDVVIASAGQGSTRGQTSLLALDTYINQSVIVLRASTDAYSSALLFLDLSSRYDEMRSISDSHSSRGSLTTKLLGSMRSVAPPKPLVAVFDAIISPMIERIVVAERENLRLATIRDLLLPRLISGKLRVEDAETMIEEAVA